MRLSKTFLMSIVGIVAQFIVAMGYPDFSELILGIAVIVVGYLAKQGYVDAELVKKGLKK